jgi:hypothetical protein
MDDKLYRMELIVDQEFRDNAKVKEIVENVMDDLSDHPFPSHDLRFELIDRLAEARRLMDPVPDPCFLPFENFTRPKSNPPSFAPLSLPSAPVANCRTRNMIPTEPHPAPSPEPPNTDATVPPPPEPENK